MLSGDETPLQSSQRCSQSEKSRTIGKASSNVEQVAAVMHPKLLSAQYLDVIIFSTKGRRSLASLLGGGDYDGGTALLDARRMLLLTLSKTRYYHRYMAAATSGTVQEL